MCPVGGGSRRYCREVTRACDGDLRAGCHEILKKLRNVLIVDVQLIFERVELRLAEGLPPFPFKCGVLWLCGLPRTRVRAHIGRGGALLEGRRSVDFRLYIPRAYASRDQRDGGHDGRHESDLTSAAHGLSRGYPAASAI